MAALDVPAILTRPRLWQMIGVLILVEVLSSLENAMIFTALPKIHAEFNDITRVGWLISGFLLAQAGTAAIGGRLGDLLGRRRVLVIIALLCGVGSLISALGTNLEVIILGRVLQGASGAILPLCFGVVREIAPAKDTPFWVGTLTGAWGVAHALGFVLGGVLSDLGGWHLIFYCTAAYAFALLLPLLTILPPTRPAGLSGGLDLGGLLFVPAVVSVLYGLMQTHEQGWDSAQAYGFLAGGAALLGFWAWREYRHPSPLIDVKLLLKKGILLGNLCYVLMALGLGQSAVMLMLLLQQPTWTGVGLGVTATVAGALKIPSSLSGAFAGPWAGFVCGRWTPRWAIVQGAALSLAAWLSILFFHERLWQVVAASIVSSIGITIIQSAIPNAVLLHTPPERSSEATGVSIVIKAVFTAVGLQLATILLSLSQATDPQTNVSFPSETAFNMVFAYICLTAAAMLSVCLLIPKEHWRKEELAVSD